MIDIVPFKPDHYLGLSTRPEQLQDAPERVPAGARTFLLGGKPIAVFGGIFVGSRVFHIWAFVSDEVRSVPIAFLKACRKELDSFQRATKMRRIQIDIRKSFPGGPHWAGALGFQMDGVLRGYAPDGEDCWLFGRVY